MTEICTIFKEKIKRVSAVILDMDGVLMDTEPIHLESFRRYLKELNLSVEESFLKSLVGFSVETNIQQIFETYFPEREYQLIEEVKRRDDIYLNLLRSTQLDPIDGIPQLLQLCRNLGVALALASSSSLAQIETILENLTLSNKFPIPLKNYFRVIVSGDDVRHKKPHPEIYRLMIRKLNIPANEAIAIEDSPAGILSAKRAGIFCIALKNDYFQEKKLQNADVIVDSLLEVVEGLGLFKTRE